MPVLYLLRHGQASFGTSDYDQLSDLGRRQATLGGVELVRRRVRTPVVVSGTLQRQRDTAILAAAEIAAAGISVDVTGTDPRFDEFDAHEAVDQHLGGPGATDGMSSAQFQAHLDDVMAAWIEDDSSFWGGFAQGAIEGLRDLAAGLGPGTDAVVATSAGVTAAVVGRLLGADAEGVIALNRVSVNGSITTLVAGSRGLSVVTFNDHAHLLVEPGLRTSR